MTWRDTIAKAGAYLQAKAVPDAQVAAELLAARLLKTGRGTLAAHLEKEVPEKCLEAMRRGMARLANGEPVQYVIGEWDFRHLTLKCDRRALIPRPETEELVTRVLAHLNKLTTQPLSHSGTTLPPVVVEQDADVVFLLRRPSRTATSKDSSDETLAIIDVAKNRNGEVGEVKVNFYREWVRFGDRELERKEDDNYQSSEMPPEGREYAQDPIL